MLVDEFCCSFLPDQINPVLNFVKIVVDWLWIAVLFIVSCKVEIHFIIS